MSLEGDDLLIVNGVCPRPGEAFTVRVPLRTNPDLDGTVIPVSRHIHHLGTALIAELMLRMYNSVAADIDAYVITNVYPFTLDKVLRPAVTVRRRFDRTLSDARTPVRFDWETWFKGRSKKKVMPRTSRRA